MNEDTDDTPMRPTADALLPLIHARLARVSQPTLPRLWEGLCARFTQEWAGYNKARGSEDTPEWEEFPYARPADLKPLLDQLGLPYAGRSAPEPELAGVPAEASESEPPLHEKTETRPGRQPRPARVRPTLARQPRETPPTLRRRQEAGSVAPHILPLPGIADMAGEAVATRRDRPSRPARPTSARQSEAVQLPLFDD